MEQQGDVNLFQTENGGDICIEDGIIEMSPGLEATVYLALFGGNEDDDGRETSSSNWWGNLNEPDEDLTYRSETQHLLQALPLNSNNLIKIEDAAKRDLRFLLNKKIASSIEVSAILPSLNTVKISISIKAEGLETTFDFTANWKAS